MRRRPPAPTSRARRGLVALAATATSAAATAVALPATAAAQAGPVSVPIADGSAVRVTFTDTVGARPDLAQSYVAYLDSLPHGSELSKLRLHIADRSEVARLCGGGEDEGILACYGPARQQMIVPASGLDTQASAGDYSVRYVLTHEYGHHIAANRRNDELRGGALDNGPKYWASYEQVCDRTLRNQLAPGDEGDRYRANPGESWAEAYARLTFPEQPWTFTPLLRPDTGALEAARRDVLTPWTTNRTATFRMASGRSVQVFDLPLTLDGSLRARAIGPRGSRVGVTVKSGNQRVGGVRATRARTTWSLASGCRERPTETLAFTVRRTGTRTGAVTLRVSYPG